MIPSSLAVWTSSSTFGTWASSVIWEGLFAINDACTSSWSFVYFWYSITLALGVVIWDVVYDFGGFDDKRLDLVSKNADLIIIPFNPTINALGTTLESYKRAAEQNIPILFVVNAIIKDQDALDAIEYLKETTRDDIEYFVIPHTRALQTSENEGQSIIELANSSGLRRHTYKKISATMIELMKLIKSYI